MEKKIILNGIFYIILTSIFIYLWIKEKQIAATIKSYRDSFSNFLINSFNIRNSKYQTSLRKTVDFIETITSAIILVLIIQRFYLGNFLVPTGSMIPTIIPKDRLFGNMVIYKFTKPKREDIIVFKEPIDNKVLYTKRLMGLPGETVQIKDDYLFINNKKISTRNYSNLADLQPNVEWIIPKKGDTLEIYADFNIKNVLIEKNIDIEKFQQVIYDHPGRITTFFKGIHFKINGKETGPVPDYIHDKNTISKLINGKTLKFTINEDYYLALGDNTNNSMDSRVWGFLAEHRIKGKPFLRFWPLNRIGLLK
ncbi:signal peptidase I [Hypnocyclicus thermotrophus]|uniref:Signal peptidase I n=1 Tax=Hypnocyclicus thermotrophus TaxID=1627895 RepID=A0AA46DYK8_9FUSO|nr:signal peptidase I [Hypnocyclicus thermotrophus]TDT70517.1 signal peptidase I [Hypnocyclicus thermotrophus]